MTRKWAIANYINDGNARFRTRTSSERFCVDYSPSCLYSIFHNTRTDPDCFDLAFSRTIPCDIPFLHARNPRMMYMQYLQDALAYLIIGSAAIRFIVVNGISGGPLSPRCKTTGTTYSGLSIAHKYLNGYAQAIYFCRIKSREGKSYLHM